MGVTRRAPKSLLL